MKLYPMFNCIYSKSKATNSEMVTDQLLKSYCLPYMMYCVEADSLSCTNGAMYRIFGACDSSSLEFGDDAMRKEHDWIEFISNKTYKLNNIYGRTAQKQALFWLSFVLYHFQSGVEMI